MRRHAARRAMALAPGLAAARGAVSASMRSCARCGASLSAIGTCCSGRPPATSSARSSNAAAAAVAADVDRRRCSRCCWRVAAARCTGRWCWCGVAAAAAVAVVAGARVVDQPAAAPTRRVRAERRQTAVPAQLARRTWAFFESHVERGRDTGCRRTTSRSSPAPVIAHRTSPTNIGLALLANLAALRFRLPRHRSSAAAHARRRWPRWSAAALPRPLLQLVRHAEPAAAGAALRLGGGQRQPRRPPADLAPRPAGTDRRAGVPAAPAAGPARYPGNCCTTRSVTTTQTLDRLQRELQDALDSAARQHQRRARGATAPARACPGTGRGADTGARQRRRVLAGCAVRTAATSCCEETRAVQPRPTR